MVSRKGPVTQSVGAKGVMSMVPSRNCSTRVELWLYPRGADKLADDGFQVIKGRNWPSSSLSRWISVHATTIEENTLDFASAEREPASGRCPRSSDRVDPMITGRKMPAPRPQRERRGLRDGSYILGRVRWCIANAATAQFGIGSTA